MIDLGELRAECEGVINGSRVVIGGICDEYTVLALVEAVEATIALVEDEESGEGGWGPDVTMLGPLVETLAPFRVP